MHGNRDLSIVKWYRLGQRSKCSKNFILVNKSTALPQISVFHQAQAKEKVEVIVDTCIRIIVKFEKKNWANLSKFVFGAQKGAMDLSLNRIIILVKKICCSKIKHNDQKVYFLPPGFLSVIYDKQHSLVIQSIETYGTSGGSSMGPSQETSLISNYHLLPRLLS